LEAGVAGWITHSELLNVTFSRLPDAVKHQFKGKVKQTLATPGISPTMAALYQCQYKLPDQKAQKILGYEPIVSFSEACDRTIRWLATQNYPVISPY
jgi:nucleoside-diphosphate-sugar epimerase